MSTKKRAKPADLYEILGDFGDAIALVSTAQRSLEQQEIASDEVSTLRLAVRMLTDAHQQFNTFADNNAPVAPSMPGIGETQEAG